MGMWEALIDRSIYDHPGREVEVIRAVRRHKDRPALTVGEKVTIVRYASVDDHYGGRPRLLVRTGSGAERWIDGSKVDPGEPTEIIDGRS